MQFQFVQKSTELERQFSQTTRKYIKRRKKAIKDTYFWVVDYTTLFAPTNKPVDMTVERKRTKEMKGAYAKRFRLDSRRTRDTSY